VVGSVTVAVRTGSGVVVRRGLVKQGSKVITIIHRTGLVKMSNGTYLPPHWQPSSCCVKRAMENCRRPQLRHDAPAAVSYLAGVVFAGASFLAGAVILAR
jgi:hypothetical protein